MPLQRLWRKLSSSAQRGLEVEEIWTPTSAGDPRVGRLRGETRLAMIPYLSYANREDKVTSIRYEQIVRSLATHAPSARRSRSTPRQRAIPRPEIPEPRDGPTQESQRQIRPCTPAQGRLIISCRPNRPGKRRRRSARRCETSSRARIAREPAETSGAFASDKLRRLWRPPIADSVIRRV